MLFTPLILQTPPLLSVFLMLRLRLIMARSTQTCFLSLQTSIYISFLVVVTHVTVHKVFPTHKPPPPLHMFNLMLSLRISLTNALSISPNEDTRREISKKKSHRESIQHEMQIYTQIQDQRLLCQMHSTCHYISPIIHLFLQLLRNICHTP